MQTHMPYDDTTLTPQMIVDHYERAYRRVHGAEPRARHIGGQWYYVSGETIHRLALMAETARLNDLARQRSFATPTRSIINRLISRLRGI
jgi:hypothetical protein